MNGVGHRGRVYLNDIHLSGGTYRVYVDFATGRAWTLSTHPAPEVQKRLAATGLDTAAPVFVHREGWSAPDRDRIESEIPRLYRDRRDREAAGG